MEGPTSLCVLGSADGGCQVSRVCVIEAGLLTLVVVRCRVDSSWVDVRRRISGTRRVSADEGIVWELAVGCEA